MFVRVAWTARWSQTEQSLPHTGVCCHSESTSTPPWGRSLGVGIRHGVGRFLLRAPGAWRQSIPLCFQRLQWARVCLPALNWRVPFGKHRPERGCWWGSWCCRRWFSVGEINKRQGPAWTCKLHARNGWKGKNDTLIGWRAEGGACVDGWTEKMDGNVPPNPGGKEPEHAKVSPTPQEVG